MWFYISMIICMLWALSAWLNSPERMIKKREKLAEVFYGIALDKSDDKDIEKEKLKLKSMGLKYEDIKKKFADASPESRLQLATYWFIYCKELAKSEYESQSEIEHRFEYLSKGKPQII